MSAVEALRSELAAARAAWAADCCTFYLRDPWWTTEFRVLAMPGVEITEPLHGFVTPGNPAITDGDDLWLVPDAVHCPPLRINLPAFDLPDDRRRLFGDFVHRERIRSCIRLQLRDGERIDAVLFASYRTPQSAADLGRIAPAIRAAFDRLCGRLPAVRAELAAAPFPAQKLLHMLRPAGQLADPRLFRAGAEPKRFFKPVLKAVFEAFAFRPEEALGGVHLFRPETHTLERVDLLGKLDPAAAERNRVLNVLRGEGVVSWAAALRRSILLDDVRQSSFAHAYVEDRPGTRSELAVPMMAGPELVGVLNLESDRPGAFTPEDARLVAYAANTAAAAYRQYQEAARHGSDRAAWYSGLLDASRKLIEHPESPGESLNELAKAAARVLRAMECDLWRYVPAGGRFKPVGASYRLTTLHGLTPRADGGWSLRVIRTGRAVWISDIRGPDRFRSVEWDPFRREWVPPTDPVPERVNPRLSERGVGCTLGLPVRGAEGGTQVVAWLRYPLGASEPGPTEMDAAQMYAVQAGLFLDSIHRYRQPTPKVLDAIRRTQIQDGRFDNGTVTGFVISKPADPGVSGDGFRVVHPSDGRLAGLLVDGEGHGIRGALNMLPILSGFRLLGDDFPGPNVVLVRLNRAVFGMAVGTAVCFTLTAADEGEVELTAVSAGHPPLLVIRHATGDRLTVPSPDGRAHPLGLLDEWSAPAETVRLKPGDWIVGYTDGVTDAGQTGDVGDGFGADRLWAAAAVRPEDTPESVARRIEAAARDHAGGEFEDDFTVLVMRVKG